MKKRIVDFIASKAFRKAMKMFIIWIIIFAIFIYGFLKFVYLMKEKMPVTAGPSIKQEQLIDTEKLRIEEIEKPVVGNMSVT